MHDGFKGPFISATCRTQGNKLPVASTGCGCTPILSSRTYTACMLKRGRDRQTVRQTDTVHYAKCGHSMTRVACSNRPGWLSWWGELVLWYSS